MASHVSTTEDEDFNAVGAWFLGAKGENHETLLKLFELTLHLHVKSRRSYFPDDPSPITPEMQSTPIFQHNIARLQDILSDFSEAMGDFSVPFWNPRYLGHMVMDTSMPGIIGYLSAMLYNPNNVAIEASPFTTLLERVVGLDFCGMVGYNTRNSEAPLSWGHMTSGGTVSNIESMWVARNLKFYPLSIKLALRNELQFIEGSFKVRTCQGTYKLFREFSTWELLNIRPNDVLDIPTRLESQYGISPTFLANVLRSYSVQTLGKGYLEEKFGIQSPSAYFASAAMHYSWPKSAALTGIGSENVIAIRVDPSARLDPKDLKKKLDKCLEDKRAVYAVVAIIGTTEHGACDPLCDILTLRNEFQEKGLSFLVHADAAWGAYFVSTFRNIWESVHNRDSTLRFSDPTGGKLLSMGE
ncbi:PLP-dependent transferase [Sistotremastrum niveocremeum HHB9708]|uniref:PLP-dependent transferase n=1 Tax=Sistotremastrum niveocremeum HHB9708 TaxID=1314777 RepID=A0A165ADN2_9AGAM|nr:PLP-dependent transferase [Sistotremastrum niveocremeum HHB9708]